MLVQRGVAHVDPSGVSDAPAVVRNRLWPRPKFIEAYVETVLANLVDGRIDGSALPPLHVAVILQDTDGKSYAADRPIWLQRVLRPLLARTGRRRGFRVEQLPA